MNIDYSNPPAHLLDQPIEPWQPKVGDRVRVRLGERPVSDDCLCITHNPEENGRLGIVSGRTFIGISEPYVVDFDGEEITCPECGDSYSSSMFDAYEIEPLDGEQ